MNNNKFGISRYLQLFLRIAAAVSIIAALIYLRKDQLQKCLAVFDYTKIIPAMCCYGFHLLVCAWRWRTLAKMQKFDLTLKEAFCLTMQGGFFSMILPGGAIGGDVVKMGILARRRQPGSRTEGIFTIFMDRVVGMVALFGLTIVLLAVFYPRINELKVPGFEISSYKLRIFAWGIFAICFAGIAAAAGIFFHSFFEKFRLIKKVMDFADVRFNNAVTRICAAADSYAKQIPQLLNLTLISVLLVHIMTALPMFFLLRGTGVTLSGHWLLILTAVTIGNIAGLIPLSPGGIGLRDLTVIAILGSGGISAGTGETAQLLYTGIMICFALSGSLFFIFDHRVPGETATTYEKVEHE